MKVFSQTLQERLFTNTNNCNNNNIILFNNTNKQWRFSAKFSRKDYWFNQGTQRLFSVKYLLNFLLLGDCYKFLDDRSIHVQFSKLICYILYDFLKFNFSHFTPRVRLFFFFIEKRKPKILGFKNVMEGERKILTFVIRYPGFQMIFFSYISTVYFILGILRTDFWSQGGNTLNCI